METQTPGAPVPTPAHLARARVLALGMAGLDLVGVVETYPAPDSKVRTTGLRSGGGGNAANSATALRRLGLPVTLVSQVGADAPAASVLSELRGDGIDTSLVQTTAQHPTALTYVLVAADAATRTCIASVPPDLSADVVRPDMLDDVDLVVLDGRHTQAATRLATLARARAVPVLLDVERERPGLRDLLPLADVIVTNSVYPSVFAPDAPSRTCAQRALRAATGAHTVVSTAGAEGSVLVRAADCEPPELDDDLPLRLSVETLPDAGGNVGPAVQVIRCPPWPAESVVDTTGAGDAYIGAFAYAMVAGLSPARGMVLGAYVASRSVGAHGARQGLPRRETIPPELLESA